MNNRSNTILIAEDDEDEHEILTIAFKKHPGAYSLIFTTNGEEALHELTKLSESKQLPLLIILDMNMPVMDGLSTLKEIRHSGEYQKVPVIMYSNSSLDDHVNNCKNAGCTDYMIKPTLFQEVLSSVERMLKYIPAEDYK